MSEPTSALVNRVEAEPAGLDVNRFLSYLDYRSCKEESRMVRDEAYVVNTRNGATVSVPLRYAVLTREVIYWICHDLGIDMPDEFTAFQEMMDGLPSNT